jgi:hypothetical protein
MLNGAAVIFSHVPTEASTLFRYKYIIFPRRFSDVQCCGRDEFSSDPDPTCLKTRIWI